VRIAVVGAGKVGAALGRRLGRDHEVVYGVREPAKYPDLGAVATPHEAVQGAGVVILAVPWPAVSEVVPGLGDLRDAVLVDATNPFAPDLAGLAAEPSGGEIVAGLATGARLVKAFNTTGAGNLARPDYGPVRPWMPLAGNDPEAKETVADLAAGLGFDPLDVGPLEMARRLEELALLWVRLAYVEGHGPDLAFALLHRPS
jgi:predicted dinucleotide-binding enzyme